MRIGWLKSSLRAEESSLSRDVRNSEAQKLSDPQQYLLGIFNVDELKSSPVFLLIAVLLFMTASAKLWMLLTDSFAGLRVALPTQVLWCSVVFEYWLALKNFRATNSILLTFLNVVVFSAFALFGIVRLAMGYDSCGCSGNIEIPGWIFVLINVFIIWLLLRSGGIAKLAAGKEETVGFLKSMSSDAKGRLAGICFFGLVLLGLQLPVASPLRAIVFGEPALSAIVQFEQPLSVDTEQIGKVEITNGSAFPANLVGINRSCNCFDFVEKPTLIPARSTNTFFAKITPIKSGMMHQRVVLFLDHPEQFRLNVNVVEFVNGVD